MQCFGRVAPAAIVGNPGLNLKRQKDHHFSGAGKLTNQHLTGNQDQRPTTLHPGDRVAGDRRFGHCEISIQKMSTE